MEDCSTCKYANDFNNFTFCENSKSDYYIKPVRTDNTCEYWEEKIKIGKDNGIS